MEKKVSSTGMYETTYSGGVFVGKLSMPTKTGLTDQTKVALLEYLTESDDFHKLVCDITGVERKQEKVSAELEKLKEEYSHMCESYENEKQQRNDLLRKMNRIKDLLKEVDMPSVRRTIEALKSERANGKLFTEKCELLKKENDMLSKRFSDLEKSYVCIHKEANEIKNSRKNLSANYDRLIEDYNCLNTRYDNQKKYIAKYIEENKRLIDQVEKLKGRLNRVAKNYGELIKTISDKAMKSI